MKRKSSRKVRTKKRRTRKQRGGDKSILVIFVLFSEEVAPKEMIESLKQVLRTTFHSEIEEYTEMPVPYKSLFENTVAGLKHTPFIKESFELPLRLLSPPAYLQKDEKPELLLTALEHQIGNALLETPLDISLIPPDHGVYGENLFIVGLCNPKCYDRYKKDVYLRMIKNVL
jgi:hypothetical protein